MTYRIVERLVCPALHEDGRCFSAIQLNLFSHFDERLSMVHERTNFCYIEYGLFVAQRWQWTTSAVQKNFLPAIPGCRDWAADRLFYLSFDGGHGIHTAQCTQIIVLTYALCKSIYIIVFTL